MYIYFLISASCKEGTKPVNSFIGCNVSISSISICDNLLNDCADELMRNVFKGAVTKLVKEGPDAAAPVVALVVAAVVVVNVDDKNWLN